MAMESMACTLCSPVSSSSSSSSSSPPCTRLLLSPFSSFSFMSGRQVLQPRRQLVKRWLPPAQLWSSSSSISSPQVRALEKLSDVMQGHCVKDAQFKVIGIDSAQETVDAPDNAGHYCCQQADDDFFAIWCQSCQALLTKALIMKGSATAALGLFLVSSQSALADESIEAGVQEAPDLVANNTLSFLFIASFLGLSVLTIGVVYLSVQDFLEKRQLESESKAVAQGKKSKATPEVVEAGQSGPRGFGGKRAKEKGKD